MVVLFITASIIGIYKRQHSPAPTAIESQISAEERAVPAIAPVAPNVTPKRELVTEDLLSWLNSYEQLDVEEQQRVLSKGVALAQARHTRMLYLIRRHPEAALKQALSLDEVERLPEEIRGLVEKPFSQMATYKSFPVCPGPEASRDVVPTRIPGSLEFSDGTRLGVFPFGGRQKIGSKNNLAVQGIQLEGLAAMRDGVFQQLTPAEVEVAQTRFGAGQADPTRSFVTGQPISGEPVKALAGGKLFSFASAAELAQFDAEVAKLDAFPGPRSGSSAIFARPRLASGAAGTGFDLPAAQAAAAEAAAEWTLTPKKLFLIRVDFSDKPGDPVTKSAAETALNGDASTAITKMSYGKTSITSTVSSGLYRLPQAAAYYAALTDGTSKNDELLDAARAAFRASKSGSDGAINIGTGGVNSSGAFGDYDIVGVTFANIDARGGNVVYAGLASVGGGDFWMQGNNDASVYTHELGHVYGLNHSNFWLTTDGSVVGAGSEVEYGDIYDVMGDGKVPQGHFNPQAKQLLSWLDSNQWTAASVDAGTSQSFRIYRIDDSLTSGSLRGVRVTKSAAGAPDPEYYWIGYRPAYTEYPHLAGGAYIQWQRPTSPNSVLIDITPNTLNDKSDASLNIGRTYVDATAGLTITTTGRGGSGSEQYLDIQVNRGPFTGNQAPALAVITGTSSATARTSVTFSAAPTDANSDTLSYYWNPGDGSVSVSGGTGASASTFTHSYTVGGTYTVSVTVSDMKGGSVTQTKSVVVADPIRSFTQRTSGTTKNFNGITSSDTLAVAVGDNGVISTSSDGITWTNQVILPSGNLYFTGVAWNGTQFTAVGLDYNFSLGAEGAFVGVIYTSPNGTTWTKRHTVSTADTSLRSVAVGGGTLLAGGDAGTVLRSTDGTTWTAVNGITALTTSHSVGGVAYGNGTFVMNANRENFGTGDGRVYSSPDGLTWTNRSSGTGIDDTNHDLRSIAYLSDRFVTSGWYSKLRVSTNNGVSFSTTRSVTEILRALTYGNGVYFAGGEPLPTAATVHVISTDGAQWTQVTAPSFFGKENGATFFKNTILIAGDSGVIGQSGTLAAPVTTQTLGSFAAIGDRVFGISPFTITAPTATSGLVVTLSVKSGPATISGSTLTLTGVGTVVVAANQVGNGTISAAPEVTTSFTVTAASQTITFGALADKTFGDAPFTVSATASSGLIPTFSVVSGSATISGSTITLTGAGNVTVRAQQSGNSNYNAASGVDRSFMVNKASQTITFGALADKTFGDAPFAVSATASSGLSPTFSILSGPATISGSTITLTGAGSVVVRAEQAGNGNYNSASAVDRTFTVGGASQTITFGALADKTFGDAAFSVSATASSGLIPTFSVVSGSATISGSTITLTGAGNVTVRAQQSGNGNYISASAVDRTFTVGRASQTITFGALADKTFGDAPFTVSATASSGLIPTFSVVSGSATISGSTLALTGAGSVVVRAEQAGNGNYNTASAVDRTFTVGRAPQTITFAALANRPLGDTVFTVSATASSGLEPTFSILAGPATIAGNTVTTSGTGVITVRASQIGNGLYLAATPVDRSFTAGAVAPVITVHPVANSRAILGGTLSLSVTATGEGLQYQWRKGGVAITGANNATYTVTPASILDAGSYSVLVSNAIASVPSQAAVVSVVSAPETLVITKDLLPTYVLKQGATLSLGVGVRGGGATRFQWRKNGVDLPDETGSFLTILGATAQDSGNYDLVIKSEAGNLTSVQAAVTVAVPVVIGTQPQGTVLRSGDRLSLSVQVTAGTQPLTYQWRKKGIRISTATTATATTENLVITSATEFHAGSYDVVITNAAGSVTSTAAVVFVNAAGTNPASVAITRQPVGRIVRAEEPLVLAVSALSGGTSALGYQWSKNGQDISNANASIYSVLQAGSSDTGGYAVRVSSGTVSVTSQTVQVTVLPKVASSNLVISKQPVGGQFAPLSAVVLSVEATGGSGALTYQWLQDGVAVPRATGSSLKLGPIKEARGGVYTVVVTDALGATIVSDAVQVRVKDISSMAGMYQGLVSDLADGRNWGRITLRMEPTGVFSGRLEYAGYVYSFRGAFDGTLAFQSTIAQKDGLAPLGLSFQLSVENQLLAVTVTQNPTAPVLVTSGELRRVPSYTGSNRSPQAGRYTLLLGDGLQNGIVNPAYPADLKAPGFGFVTVSSTGLATGTGKLPDSTSYSVSAQLGSDGVAPWYTSLYGASTIRSGWLGGELPFDAANRNVSGVLRWKKPVQLTGLFATGLDVQLTTLVCPYALPKGGFRVLGSSTGPARFTYVDANGTSRVKQLSLSTSNSVTSLDTGVDVPTVALILSKGAVSGSLVDFGSQRTLKLEGVVLQTEAGEISGFYIDGTKVGFFSLKP